VLSSLFETKKKIPDGAGIVDALTKALEVGFNMGLAVAYSCKSQKLCSIFYNKEHLVGFRDQL
jgi:hypothetical protein